MAQTEQVFHNLEVALAAAGARMEHVIKWNIYVVEGHALEPAVEVFHRIWATRANPPLITVAIVRALSQPEFLIELEALAVVADGEGS